MNIKVEKLPAKTYKMTIDVQKEKVDKAFSDIENELIKEVEIKGFRKGMAPREMAEKKLNSAKIKEDVVNMLVPEAYAQALKEHHIAPITLPEITIKQLEKNKNLIFEALVSEEPDTDLGNYKEELAKLKKESASSAIYGPDGKEIEGKGKKVDLNDILKVLLNTAKIEIPDYIVEKEIKKMMSNLIDQTAKVGLTVEDYLKSINKDIETLRKEYKKHAEESIKIDFILAKIAKEESVSATDEEVDDAINANPDPQAREELKKRENRWYVKSVIVKNKVLSKLSEMVSPQTKGQK